MDEQKRQTESPAPRKEDGRAWWRRDFLAPAKERLYSKVKLSERALDIIILLSGLGVVIAIVIGIVTR